MRYLPALLVAIGLLFVGNTLEPKQATVRSATPKVVAEMELPQTLELYFYACGVVKAHFPEKASDHCPVSPIALFTPLKQNRHGEYSPGSRIVWLNSAFTHQSQISTFGEGVTVHEMVHYILWGYDIWQDDKDKCREESLAWSAADLWVESRGRPEDMNPEWWEWYEDCDSATDDPRPPTQKIWELILRKTSSDRF